jgi:hypothetical protein
MMAGAIPQASLPKYPGMRSRESNLMRRWLALHESEYGSFGYNVRIGAGRDPGPEYADWVRQSALASSKLRMDALAWQGIQATVIELKNVAFPSGAQKLTVYGAVWASDNPTLPRPHLLLVCRAMDPATWANTSAANIRVEVLGFE